MAVSDPRPSPAALPTEVALVESDLFRPHATKLDVLQRTLLRHGDRLTYIRDLLGDATAEIFSPELYKAVCYGF